MDFTNQRPFMSAILMLCCHLLDGWTTTVSQTMYSTTTNTYTFSNSTTTMQPYKGIPLIDLIIGFMLLLAASVVLCVCMTQYSKIKNAKTRLKMLNAKSEYTENLQSTNNDDDDDINDIINENENNIIKKDSNDDPELSQSHSDQNLEFNENIENNEIDDNNRSMQEMSKLK